MSGSVPTACLSLASRPLVRDGMGVRRHQWKRLLPRLKGLGGRKPQSRAVNPLAELFPTVGVPDETTATCFRRSYAILIMGRSGSTMLGRTLLMSGLFGDPDEWFNCDPGSVAADYVAEGRGETFYSYLSHIQETTTGTNGVFGVQLSFEHLDYLEDLVPLSHVFGPQACWFFLRRRNLVAQAISAWKATASGRYHSYQEARAEAPYDADAIANHARDFVTCEQASVEFFRQKGLWPIELYYEDIVDEDFSIALFRNALQIYGEAETDKPARETYPVTRIATSENSRWEDLFRSDRRDYLAELERERPRILVPFPADTSPGRP
jgi:trehalose 2-sulfotransferase